MELNFEPYLLSFKDKELLTKDFKIISSNLIVKLLTKPSLSEIIQKSLNVVPNKQIGIYFWVMSINANEYKIYIGKTKSLERRLSDYIINFQIHSPNDYKLRFFQEFVLKNTHEAKFHLYFQLCHLTDYTAIETTSVKYYKPLINQRAIVSNDSKKKMKRAFREYYNAVFLSKLST